MLCEHYGSHRGDLLLNAANARPEIFGELCPVVDFHFPVELRRAYAWLLLEIELEDGTKLSTSLQHYDEPSCQIMKLIHSLFSLSLLLALSGLFCTTACQDDAEPTQRAGLISTDSLIHAAKVYDGKAFEHVVSTTAAGLRVSEPRRIVPMLPRQLHVEMEGKTIFRRHNLPSVSAYSFQVLAVGDTIYRQKESDAQFNADLDALFHQISMRFSTSLSALPLDSSG